MPSTEAQAARKQRLTELTIRKLAAGPKDYLVWDSQQHGLALKVTPIGAKSWKAIYSRQGRARWLHLGTPARSDWQKPASSRRRRCWRLPEATTRRPRNGQSAEPVPSRIWLAVTSSCTPRSATRAGSRPTPWSAAHLLPRWGKLQATSIGRADVKAMMARDQGARRWLTRRWRPRRRSSPGRSRRSLCTANPCRGVDRNADRSRERVLSDSELPQFWAAFDDAGLVVARAEDAPVDRTAAGRGRAMRREHIEDGWWTLPGKPVPALGWPGTKNSRRTGCG